MRYILLSLLFLNFSYLYAIDQFSRYDEMTMSNVKVKISQNKDVELMSNLIVINDFLYALSKFDYQNTLDGKERNIKIFDSYGELYDYRVSFNKNLETGAITSNLWTYKELDNIVRRNLHSNIGTITIFDSQTESLPFGAFEMHYARYEGIVDAKPDMDIVVGAVGAKDEYYDSGVVPYSENDTSIGYYGGYMKATIDGTKNILYSSEYENNLPVSIFYVENDGDNSKGRVIFDQYKVFDFATSDMQLRVQRRVAPEGVVYPELSDEQLVDWGVDGEAITYSKVDLNNTKAIYYIFNDDGSFHQEITTCTIAEETVEFNEFGILYVEKSNDIYNDIDAILDYENNNSISCGDTELKLKKRYLEGNLVKLAQDNNSLTFLDSNFTFPTQQYNHQKIADIGAKKDTTVWDTIATLNNNSSDLESLTTLNKSFIDCALVGTLYEGNSERDKISALLNGAFTKCAIVNGVLIASNDDDAGVLDKTRQLFYEILDNNEDTKFDDATVLSKFYKYSSWIPIVSTNIQKSIVEDMKQYLPNVVSINADDAISDEVGIWKHLTRKTIEGWYRFGLTPSYPTIFNADETTTLGKIAIEAIYGDTPWYKSTKPNATQAENIINFFIDIVGVYGNVFIPEVEITMPSTREELKVKLQETQNGRDFFEILSNSTYNLLNNSLNKSVNIERSIPNVAPVANAGLDTTVYTTASVKLDASASSDANKGDPLTYIWSITSKPAESGASLIESTTVNPTFIVDVDGTYVVKLIVNDGDFNSTADSVTINSSTLIDLTPPSF